MSVPTVLLPVFVLIGLTFALLLWMAGSRRNALVGGQTKIRDIALGQSNWPVRATQIGNCFKNQFEIPVLFYVLIALALPCRRSCATDRPQARRGRQRWGGIFMRLRSTSIIRWKEIGVGVVLFCYK